MVGKRASDGTKFVVIPSGEPILEFSALHWGAFATPRSGTEKFVEVEGYRRVAPGEQPYTPKLDVYSAVYVRIHDLAAEVAETID